MEFDSGLAAKYTQWVKNIATIAPTNDRKPLTTEIAALVQQACRDAVDKALQTIPYRKQAPQCSFMPDYADVPEEVRSLFDQLSTLTFYDYILLYWNYTESPYIKGLIRKGEVPPNPERFTDRSRTIKKYAAFFPQCLLTDITGAKIDSTLGAIKKKGKLKDNTMEAFRYIFIQPLRYAYRYNLLARDIAQQITRESKKTRKKAKKEAEKAIFTKEEIQRLFNSDNNPFGLEVYNLINALLLKTGCRIGELQALQIQDFIKNADGYALKVDKNYCRAGKRLKCTKTERSDIVPISNDLAAKLIAQIEKHPLKDNQDAFIFFSTKNVHAPVRYEAIRKNFITTMEKLKFSKPNLTLHSYRHTYATFLRMAGFSDEELKFLTRHDCIAEVRRYADHYSPEMEQLKHRAVIALNKIIT